ncbi:hypothetical protein BC826DRAFT_1019683 [Russula brevipes]|nr:hypothetical protein BC826DRAFT_1019683 [Russula brevipes]
MAQKSFADVVVSDARLTDKYPHAWTDFYPSRAPCIYKSGLTWEVRTGPEEQGIIREPRTVCRPDLAPVWVSIVQQIIAYLDSMDINFTCINPFAWANKGEKELLCDFLLSVGVIPRSLTHDDAVAAAVGVKAILAKSGLPEAEVAFIEMVNKRSGGEAKLLSLDPIADSVPEYRKHFSSALGLPIAPLDTPYHEGTGALYLRLSSETKDIALLTCAHVVHPHTHLNSKAKEYMVALGAGGYARVVSGMMADIAKLTRDIETWNRQLERNLPDAKRNEYTAEVEKANNRINELDAFHTKATKFRSTPELRCIGWTLHSSPIRVSAPPLGYTEDWGLIQLDPKMIDEETFLGNKVFVGGKFTPGDLAELMYPHHEDRATYRVLDDSLLQAYGVVSAAEISNPTHLDANGQPCLIVVKNGGTTGTTLGCANGLPSVQRSIRDHGTIKQDSLEIAVVFYGKGHGKFSDPGDSGAIVLTREGKILGMLTSGAGPTDETDVTYLTPFWWVLEQIQKQYPGAHLYDVVQK